MPLNSIGMGYGRPQQVIGRLDVIQAKLDPKSTEYQSIEQRKSDLVELFSQNNPLTFLANAPPPTVVGPEPSKQERLNALTEVQASLSPNSSAYQKIEKIKSAILSTPDVSDLGYGTPQQLIVNLSALQANFDPNSAEYHSIENRKQVLFGNSSQPNSNNPDSMVGLLVSMMKTLVQGLSTMIGSKA